MSKKTSTLEDFENVSAALTGFLPLTLKRTGVSSEYFALCRERVGRVILEQFLSAMKPALRKRSDKTQAIDKVLDDEKLGPVGRNIIQLWYLGGWSEMPKEWRDANHQGKKDPNTIPSALAYKEGLVWKALETHPMGAKAPGFGSWALKP